MKTLIIIVSCLVLSACAVQPKADYVLVKKSQNKMYLFQRSEVLKTYDIAMGFNPKGHKVQEGDGRTPEGDYRLTYKNQNSKFYRSIRIDYPNERDIELAKQRGIEPGGDIVIHGMPNEAGNYLGPIKPQNWTLGCVAVRNHEMDQLWALIDEGTPIKILP